MTDKEILSLNIQDAATLEYLGIKTEDTQINEKSAVYKFSVPEESITDKGELSSDELIQLYKETIIKMGAREIFDSEDDMDEQDEEFINSYFKFYCKVRKHEIWRQDDASEILSSFINGVKTLTEYKEV